MPTLTNDPAYALLVSDAWGTSILLGQCEKLSRDQFHTKFAIGLGSLHDTLTHMLSATRRWTDRLAGRTPRPMLMAVPEFPHVGGETMLRTPAELREIHDKATHDLLGVLLGLEQRGAMGDTIALEWPGDAGIVKVYTFSKAAVVAHIGSHGYHHRAQCLNMLRQLGAPVPGVAKDIPELSAVDWQSAIESPPTVKHA